MFVSINKGYCNPLNKKYIDKKKNIDVAIVKNDSNEQQEIMKLGEGIKKKLTFNNDSKHIEKPNFITNGGSVKKKAIILKI